MKATGNRVARNAATYRNLPSRTSRSGSVRYNSRRVEQHVGRTPEVGAVAPKLLYATRKIQHAGLVTGVRGLVGTACHQWPADSTDYSNFAQSMRMRLLCRRRVWPSAARIFSGWRVRSGEHADRASDLDLCFKIRAAGMRCVYPSFATMSHRGHASIGALEEEKKAAPDDRPSVFLLKRWPAYTSHDPYYPDNVRDSLYADSPTPVRMWGRV